MKKTLKKGLLALFAMTATLCTSLSVGAIASAEETPVTGKSIDEVTFTMVNGASIRADSFGIRFSATMSEADYTALDAYYEEEIEFGTFIMAANYKTAVSKGTFEESHFFGDYDADETTTSLYTWDGASVSENRVKILQMDSKIYYDEEWQTMRVNGSVTRVFDHNLDMDYVGISYIKVGNEYRLATQGDNARSVVYVAQLAIEANKKVEDVTAGSSVLTHYTTKVEEAVTTVNYTVNTYLHDAENGAVKYDTTVVENHPLNEKAEVTNIAESINGYTYVASRSTTSGVAYIGDKLVLELYYHKKASGILYDFYDKTEADVDLYGNGTYAEIDGVSAVKYVKKSAPWTEYKLPREADEKFDVTNVKSYYFKVYPLQVEASTELRFTSFTYSYNATTGTGSWTEKHNKLTANTWNYVTVSVGANTPSISSIYYSIQKNSVAKSWVAIGEEEGDALYIAEVGFSETAITDYTNITESYGNMLSFLVPNTSGYKMAINTDPAYVSAGKYSLKLISGAGNKWPIWKFTEEFYNWLYANNITKFSFDLYLDGTNEAFTKATGIIWKSSPSNNTWLTFTISTSYFRERLNTAHKDAGHCAHLLLQSTNGINRNAYLDNLQFTYGA